MNSHSVRRGAAWAVGAGALVAIALLHAGGQRLFGGDGALGTALLGWALVLAWAAALAHWPRLAPATWLATGAALLAYLATQGSGAAWLLLVGYEALLLAAGRTAGRRWTALGAAGATVAAGAAVPLLVAQLESRFSDEEFAVALVGILLAAMVAVGYGALRAVGPAPAPLRPRGAWPLLALAVPLALALLALPRYQQSFYGASAAPFPAIDESAPFLCATLPNSAAGPLPDSAALFDTLVARVAANERADSAEFGWLALASGEAMWAARFRESLLADAAMGRYTEPAHSVKYFQRDAAFRAYFYDLLRQRQPSLFSEADQEQLGDWFAAINQRAMTVEWVDGLYGLAFRAWQPGPYANQEIGSGLIAVLQATGLEAPALREANARYLASGQGGWHWRWRNSDDTYEYQRVWLDSALLQRLVQDKAAATPDYRQRQQHAFEWLMLQMRPDGHVPSYNNPPASDPPANTLLLGAALTGDGRFLWAAERMLAARDQAGYRSYAQPGLLSAPTVSPAVPTEGSCLLYGESGLPNQAGPLAPDKLVLRDGWQQSSHYALLNLRFAGWHRYKGSGSLSQVVMDGEALLSDVPGTSPWAWVPAGRQKFRDKRIARSQLNGLLVPRSGAAHVVHTLTGLGERWAQDPPFYATVERFSPLPGLDVSRSGLEEWRGWNQQRTLLFFHDGPLLIWDEAAGGAGQAALSWNSERPIVERDGALWLGEGVRVAAAALDGTATISGVGSSQLLVVADRAGHLSHLTALLPAAWGRGEFQAEGAAVGQGAAVTLRADEAESLLLLNARPGEAVQGAGLDGDGELLVWQRQGATQRLCYLGGSRASVPLPQRPSALHSAEGALESSAWQWTAGRLTLSLGALPRDGCLEIRQ